MRHFNASFTFFFFFWGGGSGGKVRGVGGKQGHKMVSHTPQLLKRKPLTLNILFHDEPNLPLWMSLMTMAERGERCAG